MNIEVSNVTTVEGRSPISPQAMLSPSARHCSPGWVTSYGIAP
jgi:hypothetical protein